MFSLVSFFFFREMNSHRKVFSYILQINSILLRKCERKSLECSTWLVLIWLTTECNASFKSRTRLISFTTQGFQEDDENKGAGTSVFCGILYHLRYSLFSIYFHTVRFCCQELRKNQTFSLVQSGSKSIYSLDFVSIK